MLIFPRSVSRLGLSQAAFCKAKVRYVIPIPDPPSDRGATGICSFEQGSGYEAIIGSAARNADISIFMLLALCNNYGVLPCTCTRTPYSVLRISGFSATSKVSGINGVFPAISIR